MFVFHCECGQVFNGLICLGGSGEYRPFILFQHPGPRIDVAGVVDARFGGDGQFGAQEGRAHFGNQFLGGISLAAEAIAQIAGASVLVAGSVDQFV